MGAKVKHEKVVVVVKWMLATLSLLLALALSGCTTGPFCVLPEPMCQVTTPPPVAIAQFLGVWVNEDPQPNQVTRIEVFTNQAGATAMRVWEACGPVDCAFQEGGAIGYLWGERKALEAQVGREDEEGRWRVVHVSLDEPINNRLRAEIAFLQGDSRPPPDVYYFVRLQPQE